MNIEYFIENYINKLSVKELEETQNLLNMILASNNIFIIDLNMCFIESF